MRQNEKAVVTEQLGLFDPERNRETALQALRKQRQQWDFIVIGGGATGLGTALEAASRGFRTLLLEQSDFGKGTSSRSTKLIHGGVRYLRQGNFSLVKEALRERGLLVRNAPHLVQPLTFLIPLYRLWERPFYATGLKLYDRLAGRLSLGPSQYVSRRRSVQRVPTIRPNGLRGGVLYSDAQFDDARLAVTLMRTVLDQGGVALNYVPVRRLLKRGERVCGVIAEDLESGEKFELASRVVVNAAGVFSDAVRQMDDPSAEPIIVASQGIHLVLRREFLPGDCAVIIPRTDDGRVVFALPWYDRVVVGTTETPVDRMSLEPVAREDEVDFLLQHIGRYLTLQPRREDILSVFAGLRPLVKLGRAQKTAAMSRDHTLLVSPSGLLTITGGKWTTYRKMGEDTVDRAIEMAGLQKRPSISAELRLQGWTKTPASEAADKPYGAEAPKLKGLVKKQETLAEILHPNLPYRQVNVVWATRFEMARTLEDVLARRTRALILNARACLEAAPKVAELMAAEIGRDRAWQTEQLASFENLAKGYLAGERVQHHGGTEAS